jgi:peptidoglycan/LPS O-acetylase OafA/YrhL
VNKSLNTFRAFAFLSIYLFHSVNFGFGYLGVNAFFVLSGYLITPILLKTKSTFPSFKDYLVNFYGRRFFRIFPPYYLYLLIITVLIYIMGWQNIGDYKAFLAQLPWTITYMYNFYHASTWYFTNELVVHFWSLAVEEQFYIVWPVLLFFIPKSKLKATLITLIIAGPIIRYLTALTIEHHLFWFINPWKEMVIYVSPFSHIDAFVMGGFFSLYLREYVPSTKLILGSFLGVIGVGIITTILFSANFKLSLLASLGYDSFMKDSYKYIWGYSAFSLLFSILLLRLNKRDFWPAMFENNVLDYLGKISYGLYIYHFVILKWIVNYVDTWNLKGIWMHRAFSSVIALILTIIVSIISYEFFEKKLLILKDKYFSKSRQAT